MKRDRRDAFSHNPTCDDYFSESVMLNVDPVTLLGKEHYPLLPGGLAAHTECNCWCHAPAFDKDVEPEYL